MEWFGLKMRSIEKTGQQTVADILAERKHAPKPGTGIGFGLMKTLCHDSANDIPDNDWVALTQGDDPFASRAFLGTVEEVDAGGTVMGWQARHLSVRDDNHQLLGLLPMYLRSHSFGDFSRDWGWAAAWQRAGLNYYPKLVSGIPYTPSPGPRLLVRDGIEREPVTAALITGALDLLRESGASSWQCLFVEDRDRTALEAAGLLMRRGVQFHWQNRGYQNFDDFLAGFTAAKRKKLKRERRAVHESGLRLEVRHGDEIDPPLWQAIHRHYRDTFVRYGNHPAFPLTFFAQVGARLGRRMVVFVAFDGMNAVASAICYRDTSTLYGRHWGCDIDVPGLHFELCFHQGIEYAITHGLQRFEPGAQGEHKLARGFEPVPTWSGFWVEHPGMRRAVADFIQREDAAMQDYEAETAAHLPFKTFSTASTPSTHQAD
jgi:predicted N-acyltransferase